MSQPFTRLTAVAVPYDAINVDTDQIVPARFIKTSRAEGYGKFLFHDLRYRDDGSENPDFVLNREPYRRAKILVGNANFGCGSSREGAVYAFADYGFASIIASGFGDIFHNNCFKNGVLPVRLEGEVCDRLRGLLKARPGAELSVDLVEQVVIEPEGARHGFSVDAFWRELLLNGVDELELTLGHLPRIEAFERAYAAEAPWIVRSPE